MERLSILSLCRPKIWNQFLCFEPYQLPSKTGNCNTVSFGGRDTFRLGMKRSARIKVASFFSLWFVLIKSLKSEFFLCLNTWYITNICSYTTYRIFAIALLKLLIFKETGELKNLVQGTHLLKISILVFIQVVYNGNNMVSLFCRLVFFALCKYEIHR